MRDLREAVKEQADGVWIELGVSIFGKLAGSTTTLIIGWGIHAFLM
jgi:hypothetical protein